jgi:hypothetical protein
MSRANFATRQQFQFVPIAGLPCAKNAGRPETGGRFAMIAPKQRIPTLTLAAKADAPFRFVHGFPAITWSYFSGLNAVNESAK